MTRNAKFGVLTLVVVVAVLELQCWLFGCLSMRLGALRFYPPDLFSQMTDEQLARYAPLSPLGWPAADKPRETPSEDRPICGSALGDSMTWGAEVEAEEGWVHQVSRKLGCNVANYAHSAYGLDQAVLRYERVRPTGNIVIIGMFAEMLRRSVAASWTFYASTEPGHAIKPFFSLEGDGLRLHPIPTPLTREAIAAHHAHDYYKNRVWTELKFPLCVCSRTSDLYTVARTDDYRLLTDSFWGAAHPSGSGMLARRLVDRLAQATRESSGRLAVVLLPHVDRLSSDNSQYDRFADDLRRRDDVCVIDTRPTLRRQAAVLGVKALSAPNKHYNVFGNRLVAEAVVAGLHQCNIWP
jgi:hypothetical protein